MTIQQFESEVPQKELKIGREHFSHEKVMDLQEISPGKWTGNMMSTKYISITVEMKGDTITNASCPCSVFKPDFYCKHVIAVLYGIQYAKGLISDADAFVGSDPGINGGPSTTASDDAAMVTYAKQVREAFWPFRDITGHIYRDKTRLAMKKPEQLLQEAEAAIAEKDFTKAVNITIAVIEAVSVGTDKMEHGRDISMEFFDRAFKVLEKVCDKTDKPLIKKRLCEHALNIAEDMTITIGDEDIHWLSLLIHQKLDGGKKKKKIMDLLKELIATAKEQNKNYEQRKFQELQLSYLQNNGHEKEAQAMLQEQPDLKYSELELAMTAIKLRSNEKLDKAKAEMMAAKESGDKTRYLHTRFSLYQLLLSSDDKEDKLALRVIAIEMLEFSPHPQFLEAIKKTYTAEEWKTAAPQYEQLLKKKETKKPK